MNTLLAGAVILAAQVSTGPAKNSRVDPIEPCCNVVSINTQTGEVTARVTRTGQTFTLSDIPAGALGSFKVGATLDLACAVPPSGATTGASGNAASSGSPTTATMTTNGCGSNVSRTANTKPVQPPPRPRPAGDCHVKTASGGQLELACPVGVPIKVK